MSLTRKHFRAIATAVHEARDHVVTDYERLAVDSVAKELASWLRTENPRFDRMRFLDACGVGESMGADRYDCPHEIATGVCPRNGHKSA